MLHKEDPQAVGVIVIKALFLHGSAQPEPARSTQKVNNIMLLLFSVSL